MSLPSCPVGPTLETDRLVLRPPIQADLDDWAAAMADDEVQRFLGGVQPRAIAWRFMAGAAGSWALLGFGMFSVVHKASGRWMGRVGPLCPEGWPGREVGWGLAREFWGEGYALEAAAASLDYVFDGLGWGEVIHCIDPQNMASIAVARRLGSTRVGAARLPPPSEVDVDLYGQSREKWRSRAPSSRTGPKLASG